MRPPSWAYVAVFAAGWLSLSSFALPQARPAPVCIPVPYDFQIDFVQKDMPLTATQMAVCERRKADRSVARVELVVHEWRDSEGRTRTQRHEPFMDQPGQYSVSVVDPVRHLAWSWSIGKGVDRTAIVSKYHLRAESVLWPSNGPAIAHYPKLLDSTHREEILPPQYVNGVYAEGDRTVNVVPPGWDNNKSKHPELVTTEVWVSLDIREVVREWTDDPGLGDYGGGYGIERYVSDRNEPDPRLFQPPPDYKVLVATPKGKDTSAPDRP